jgi:single-strand DNA-binding protein
MAVSRNRVDLMGYLGGAPELKFHETFTTLTFSLAIGEKWTAGNGEKREHTEWVRCTLIENFDEQGRPAARTTFLASACRTGSAVAIEGKLRTREWEKDGERRRSTDVRIDDVQLLDRAPEGGAR